VNGADQFHVGIVVDDLDATLDEMAARLGYQWCPPMALPMPLVLPSGQQTVDLRFTYSATVPRVEVIQTIPGTLWVPVEGSGIHHLGYWSDDVAADVAQLTAGGYAMEATGVQPDGTPYWAYYRHPRGPRIELVSRQVQAGLEQYWATGSADPGRSEDGIR
jgi:hypothetical protein